MKKLKSTKEKFMLIASLVERRYLAAATATSGSASRQQHQQQSKQTVSANLDQNLSKPNDVSLNY